MAEYDISDGGSREMLAQACAALDKVDHDDLSERLKGLYRKQFHRSDLSRVNQRDR